MVTFGDSGCKKIRININQAAILRILKEKVVAVVFKVTLIFSNVTGFSVKLDLSNHS